MTMALSAASSAAKAERACAALVARDPSRALDAATETRLRVHAETVLGSARYLPWLRLYTLVHGRFADGWLPDTYLARNVLPVVQGAAGRRLGANRTLARRLLGTEMMPDLAYRVRGFWLDRKGRPIGDLAAVQDSLFATRDTVLLRRDGAPRGQGMDIVDRDRFARETSADPGDLTVLPPVATDPGLDTALAGAPALLRIITVKAAGAEARPLGALLRLGRSGAPLPQPGTEILLPIDLASGAVTGPGLAGDWQSIRHHPDGGADLTALCLPGRASATAAKAVTRLHDGLPHLALVGWDIAIGPRGKLQLIDWETGAVALGPLQALQGPVLAGLDWDSCWQRDALPGAAPGAAAGAPAAPPVVTPAPVRPQPAAVQPLQPRRPVIPFPIRRRA